MAWVVGDLSDHVDLELASQVVERQHLERPGKADARVVDQSIQPAAGKVARDLVDGRVDRGGQRDVEDDDAQAPRRAGEGGRVRDVLDAREHVMTVGVEAQRGRRPDSAGGAGDQNAGHVRGTPAGCLPISRAPDGVRRRALDPGPSGQRAPSPTRFPSTASTAPSHVSRQPVRRRGAPRRGSARRRRRSPRPRHGRRRDAAARRPRSRGARTRRRTRRS